MAICALCTSCLKYGLPDLDNSDKCELTSITFEHRWTVKNSNGYEQMARQILALDQNTPDSNNEIFLTITVPEPNGVFTQKVREQVTLDRLYLTSIISPAAKITPVGDTPKMGYPSKFEINRLYEYQVTAANGKKAIYKIIITDFKNR